MERKRKESELPAGIDLPTAAKLRNAQGLQGIFELVKEVVWKAFRIDQAGLLVGLAELGIGPRTLGAFYSPDANTIVINRTVMDRIGRLEDRELFNSYCFYILLHEYLHSCGFYDEAENRQIVAAVSANEFGLNHPVTRLATTTDTMPRLIRLAMAADRLPQAAAGDGGIEFINGIDRDNTNYIM